MDNTLPLYSLFENLRKSGFELGIAEYYALLDALHSGFRADESKSPFEKENVKFICEMLWLKPSHSRYEFEAIFEDNFKITDFSFEKTQELENSEIENDSSQKPDNQENIIKKQNTEPQVKPEKEDFQKPEPTPETSLKTPQSFSQKEEFRIKVDLSGITENSPSTQKEDQSAALTKKYLFSENYFGISERQMERVCRSLPVFRTAQGTEEIDSQETVLDWAKRGFFEKITYKSQKNIANKVVLFTDNKGSMQAFEPLGDQLNEAFKKTFGKQSEDYFFYNVPQDYFYKDKIHIDYEKKSDFLKRSQAQKPLIIIFSDAGAARGGNSDGRFRATLRWLIPLKKVAPQIIWLNPMPTNRWENTTAERLARFVPMFSLHSQTEFQQAINLLKGKTRWKTPL